MNPPVVLSSTFVSQGVPGAGEPLYGRMDAATWHPFEETLGTLEGSTHPALVFGSGMAAIAAALSLVPPGGRLVLPRHAYQVTLGYAQDLQERLGIDVTLVDIDDTAAVVAALSEPRPASMLWVETPTNPMLEVADLPALVEAAHAVGALVGVDNTFATPLVQRPFEHGADVVVHSVTKYLAGHTDVVLGAALADDDDLHARLHAYRTLHGSIAGPFEVWLALRGLRTLALRVERAQSNAAELARRLSRAPRRRGGPAPEPARRPGPRAGRAAHGRLRRDHRPAPARRTRRGRRRRRRPAAVGARDEPRRRGVDPGAPPPVRHRVAHRAGGPAADVGRHRGRRGPLARPRAGARTPLV